MSGSMALVIPQTALQRVIPGAALGRVSAVFLTAEAAATLAGSVAGPFLAQAAGLTGGGRRGQPRHPRRGRGWPCAPSRGLRRKTESRFSLPGDAGRPVARLASVP